MKRFKVTGRFSTVIVIDGANLPFAFAAGDEVELEDESAALIERDLPGYLQEIKPKAAPKKKKTVETKAGRAAGSSTRQVAATKKKGAK